MTRTFFTYILVGILNTAVGYGLFALFISFGIHYSLAVLLSTLLGVLLALLLPSVNSVQAGLSGAAIMTTWCFLALFVWPTLNRVWMRHADSFLASLATPGEVRDLLSKIERLNATDISLSPAKTTVFHPIPPLQDRLSNLDRLS